MVPTPRSRHASTRAQATLEIIPDTRFIVFHGSEHEASPVKLTGKVRLTTPEPMSILKPRVRLEGKRKISWWYMGGISAGEVVDKRVFWNVEQKMGIESAHKVKAGTIEWPFEFELSPAMPESVEGLRETFIVYHLHASVSRPGWNAKDIIAQEHIRIVRTLGQDSMEMTRSRVNADIWANKISYSISIPTDAVVFGTSITADVELSPIKKGIRLGRVEMRLMETVVKRIQASEVPDVRGDRSKSDEAEVVRHDMDFPEHTRVVYDDETAENPTIADEMYKFKATLPLPKSLNVCRQDVDMHQINISHRFKLMVNIHNPEGHISQLVCRLPVKLFISPNMPVDERNEVSGTINGVSEEQLNDNEATLVAPPEYGRHILDQMYSDIDPSGYMSRAGSAPATPYGIMAQSRRGSQEHSISLNGVADAEVDDAGNHGSAAPQALHTRLANLQQMDGGPSLAATNGISGHHSPSGGNSPAPADLDSRDSSPPRMGSVSLSQRGSYFGSADASARSSAQPSRRTSDEADTTGIQSTDYDISSLSRVPSYGATLRTPGHVTPFREVPPSYMEATSRPPSPPSQTQTPGQDPLASLQRPDSVHLRSGGVSTTSTVQQQLTSRLAHMSTSPSEEDGPPASHDDGAGRLRIIRART